jgi:hypothetical protein
VSVVQFFADDLQLPALELADGEAAPAIGRPNDGRVHQLQDRALAEGVGHDLRSPALFEEQPLQEIGGPDHLAMPQREAEMGDARLEVVEEAADRGGEIPLETWTKSSRRTVARAGEAAS